MKDFNNRKEYKIKIGDNIRTWRELKGLKQVDLAKQIDISPEALSNIENGVSKPNIERMEDIADALEIEVTQLLINPQQLFHFRNNSGKNEADNAKQPAQFDDDLLQRVVSVMEKITAIYSYKAR